MKLFKKIHKKTLPPDHQTSFLLKLPPLETGHKNFTFNDKTRVSSFIYYTLIHSKHKPAAKKSSFEQHKKTKQIQTPISPLNHKKYA